MSLKEPFESVPMANDHPDQVISLSQALLAPRIVIEDTQPVLEGGAFAAKAISNQPVAVSSKVFSDGHDRMAVTLNWRQAGSRRIHCVPMTAAGNDLWLAEFIPTEIGPHLFSIEAWIDPFATYCHDLEKKYQAGVDIKLELEEGRLLLGKGIELSGGALRDQLQALADRLPSLDEDEQVAVFLGAEASRLMAEAEHRSYLTRSIEYPLDVDRPAAQFASWYELFPRSCTDSPERHGTFNDVHQRLPMIRDMGFDVLYFPPIHPIGSKHRKGRNNSLQAQPGDPGSPYAIGSPEGGHDAIHPQLGSREDFRRLVSAAAQHGLEIALDFAIQCSQDHPWLQEHPGWFSWRPDGTIRYAENPPKKYQDIVNVDFYAPDAVPGLWLALRDVIIGWVEEGVKTFRVDNPHTKPLPFWQWLIANVRSHYPDVIFLAEAFTKPAMMARLGKVGYAQSYTYFTWRNPSKSCASTSNSSTSRPGASATGPISSSTRRTSTRSSCSIPGAPAFSSVPPWRPWVRACGACIRASNCARRRPCRARRNTWTRRSTRSARAITPSRATSSPRSPSSTAFAGRTRRCRPTWAWRSSTAGTTTSCTSPSARPSATTTS